MENILNILKKKQDHLHTISPSSPVSNALCQMSCEDVDYLVVVDDYGSFVGLISEHDIALKVIFPDKPAGKFFVKDIMNIRLPAATINHSIESCMKLMQQFHTRYLPVFENFIFRGVVSADDIIKEALVSRNEIFDKETDEPVTIVYIL